jgi:hypothetical protein
VATVDRAHRAWDVVADAGWHLVEVASYHLTEDLMIKSLFFFAFLTLSIPFVAAGCGSASPADICQKECDCMKGCKQADLTTCTKEGDQLEDEARQLGCGGQFDDLLSCGAGLSCSQIESNGACAGESTALESCLGSGQTD